MIRLGDHTSGRANNTQLLRLLAASAVMFFHSYAFTGRTNDEPLYQLTLHTHFGSLGVKCFFVLSGFLVTQSWLRRSHLPTFAAARALRIYPALFAAVALSILLGSMATIVPWREYMSSPMTISYAWHNALGWHVEYLLPGAFASNPFPNGVNGSLWTLAIELRLYVAVAVFGAIGLLARKRYWAAAFCALLALFSMRPEWLLVKPNELVAHELVLLFALGSLAYAWRDSIPLSIVATLAGVALYAWNPAGSMRGFAFNVLVTYTVLVLAYHPRLQWPPANRLGDYSYGMYVYAFPIQQTIVYRFPGVTVTELFFAGFMVTLATAAASWHFLEKPFLRLKLRFQTQPAQTDERAQNPA
ncbi:MAG TPA: acyltransferase [Casimicrobiaceae bacterium]